MTQSIPAQAKFTSDEDARHQRLMELIEAEDAANGEVGCGQPLGKGLSAYFSTCGFTFDEEKLRCLLREHLGHILMEPDFDSITNQIQRRSESLVVQAGDPSLSSASVRDFTNVTEHIPTKELRELLRSQIADFCAEDTLEQLIQWSHQIIHKAVLQPRHTWSKPIWVLRGEAQIYIVQETAIEAAIAKVKAQHPQETGTLEVITVGGILAPDQVISVDTNLW